MKHIFHINYDDGVFWHNYNYDCDSGNPYEAPAPFGQYDELANGFKWGAGGVSHARC